MNTLSVCSEVLRTSSMLTTILPQPSLIGTTNIVHKVPERMHFGNWLLMYVFEDVLNCVTLKSRLAGNL